MRYNKRINGRFFEGESGSVYYVLGSFYACYVPQEGNKFVFRSSHEGLIEIVKREMESNHSTITDNRGKNSHFFQVDCANIKSRLGELGLNVPKKERAYPELADHDHADFIRGFMDAQSCMDPCNHPTKIYVQFNKSFIDKVHSVLERFAYVCREGPKRDHVTYAHEDCIRIRNFIYTRDAIERGLYLPEKKELLCNLHRLESRRNIGKGMKKNMELARQFILQDMPVSEIAEKLGYSCTNSFLRAFRKHNNEPLEMEKN